MVLLVVLVVVVMISLAGFGFSALMLTENKAVHLHGEEIQVTQVALSGEEFLKAVLEQPLSVRRQLGGLDDNPNLFRGVSVFETEDSFNRGRFSVIAPRIEDGSLSGIRFGVENESARLSLPAVLDWEQQQPQAGLNALTNLPAMTLPVANALLDWIDVDAEPRQMGAESDYYASLVPNYAPRNGIPPALNELLLVKDVTRELLFGFDANRNHRIEPHERGLAAQQLLSSRLNDDDVPWASLLTLYSAERNESSDGRLRIHLNQPDLVLLHEQLLERLDEEWANFLVAYRQFGPSAGNGSPRSAASADVDLTLPAQYRIESVLDLIEAATQAKPSAASEPVTIMSPISGERETMRNLLPALLDNVTVVESSVVTGRINLNLAPRSVLLGVPGMDEALVEQILANRNSFVETDEPDRRHPTWLLTEGLVDVARMKAIEPYLTAGGDVVRAQIVGFFDNGGPASRIEVVIDATTNPPRQLARNDLRLLGRGYSLESLGAEPEEGPAGAVSRRSGRWPDAP